MAQAATQLLRERRDEVRSTAGTGNAGSGANGGTAGTSNGGTGGTATGGTGAGGSGGGTCAREADFGTCADCFCAEDQTGCGALITAQDAFLCGNACGETCAAYCADMQTDLISECIICVNANEDADDIAACQADADCVSFAGKLQTCPAP